MYAFTAHRGAHALRSAPGRNGTGFQRAFAAERPLAGVRGWSSRKKIIVNVLRGGNSVMFRACSIYLFGNVAVSILR